jgi:Raf kinase inhibitor-like YbhB/YbcL family protein
MRGIRFVGFAALAVWSTAAAIAQPAGLTLTSPAFKHNTPIPLTYSGYGDYKSPPLEWSGAPAATREFALTVADPDVPLERFSSHWVLYNIPAAARSIPADLPATATLVSPPALKGTMQGPNAIKRIGFLPPKPFADSGVHHYTFTLYALSTDLALAGGLDKDALLTAIAPHVVAQATLVGTFERKEP